MRKEKSNTIFKSIKNIYFPWYSTIPPVTTDFFPYFKWMAAAYKRTIYNYSLLEITKLNICDISLINYRGLKRFHSGIKYTKRKKCMLEGVFLFFLLKK